MTVSPSRNDLVMAMAVLWPSTGVTMAGLPLDHGAALRDAPGALGDGIDPREHLAQRAQPRIDLAHRLGRARQPLGGRPPGGIHGRRGRGAHHDHHQRHRQAATQAPALQAIDRRREQQRQEQRHGNRDEHVLREVHHHAGAQDGHQPHGLVSFESGWRCLLFHRVNVGDEPG